MDTRASTACNQSWQPASSGPARARRCCRRTSGGWPRTSASIAYSAWKRCSACAASPLSSRPCSVPPGSACMRPARRCSDAAAVIDAAPAAMRVRLQNAADAPGRRVDVRPCDPASSGSTRRPAHCFLARRATSSRCSGSTARGSCRLRREHMGAERISSCSGGWHSRNGH